MFAGQVYEQVPHSIQTVIPAPSASSNLFSCEYLASFVGIKFKGHAPTHCPHLKQGVSGFSATSSFVKTKIPEVAFITGACKSN